MKLATVRTPEGTAAVVVGEQDAVAIDGFRDLGELLATPGWREVAAAADGAVMRVSDLDYAPPVLRPSKIICVGLNYRQHILEMGRELPEQPTLFAKFADAIIGANDDIALPPETDAMDWEGELALVIGRESRRVGGAEAEAAIAGYCILNDVTMRDWQFRTREWLQGKTWQGSTPVGPWLVTTDELRPGAALVCTVDDAVQQQASTADLVFGPADLVAYVSTMITLRPGDLIATGTPGGVGHARKPPRYLAAGSVLRTTIEGLGQQRNRVVEERL